jgi:hypothetical protein
MKIWKKWLEKWGVGDLLISFQPAVPLRGGVFGVEKFLRVAV